MFGAFEYLMGWLIVVCGKLYAYLCPPPKDDVENEDQLDKE